MFREFKAYLAEHRDIIFTIGLLMIADSFFLNGALRARLEASLHKLTDKLDKKLDTPNAPAQQ